MLRGRLTEGERVLDTDAVWTRDVAAGPTLVSEVDLAISL